MAWTPGCWSGRSAWKPPCGRWCTTAPTCTVGCGHATSRTWTPRGRRCSGPSRAPGRPATTSPCGRSCPTWPRPRRWPATTRRPGPRSQLLIASGDLDGAVSLADEQLTDRHGTAAAFIRALIRGRATAWRVDAAAAARHFEQAARYADELGYADPAVRQRVDSVLAEAYVAEGRPEAALRISAWLRDIGERQGRPAWTG